MGTPLGLKYIPYTYMDPLGLYTVSGRASLAKETLALVALISSKACSQSASIPLLGFASITGSAQPGALGAASSGPPFVNGGGPPTHDIAECNALCMMPPPKSLCRYIGYTWALK